MSLDAQQSSINPSDKNTALIQPKEQSNYVGINGKAEKENESSKKNPVHKRWTCPKPKCCNRCMCGYLCLLILFLIGIILIIFIYGIIPLFDSITPEIHNVFIQLFDYGIHQKRYLNHFDKVYFNGSGAFAVEAYNPNIVGFYMHDWKLEAIALNVYQNKEQWGDVYCCSNNPHWSKDQPYTNNYTFLFDKKQWIGSKETTNMSFILFVDDLDEELFYVGWEASWLNDWRLGLSLTGNGWGKTKLFNIDIKLVIDCSIYVNASYFFPLHPPSFNRSWNITSNGNIENVNDLEYNYEDTAVDYSFPKQNIGRIPPRKYVWQKFPVLDLNCTFGIAEFKF